MIEVQYGFYQFVKTIYRIANFFGIASLFFLNRDN